MTKATVTLAKKLGANRSGWAGFKHRLMDHLGIPQDQFDKWNVPEEWKDVYCRANGRKLGKHPWFPSKLGRATEITQDEKERLSKEILARSIRLHFPSSTVSK